MAWGIACGRTGKPWGRYTTKRAAALAFVRAMEPDLKRAPDAFVMKHWGKMRKMMACSAVSFSGFGSLQRRARRRHRR